MATRQLHSQDLPDDRGFFGPYGGRFVPPPLEGPLQALEDAFLALPRRRFLPARAHGRAPPLLAAARPRSTTPSG
jgi:hypothetical protein